MDVVLLTKNSERFLRECLNSIYREVPIHRLIVVDGLSTDNTLNILREYGEKHLEILLISDDGNRATARQKGIEAAETDWFMFMDSDVVLREGWFKNAVRYTSNPNIGAVQGTTAQRIEPVIGDFDHAMRRIRSWLGGLTYKPFLEPEHRGFTGDILIRRDLVADIKIPRLLHCFEDHYIKKWVERKGFLWFRAPDAWCDHYMEGREANRAFRDSQIGYIIGYISLKRSLMAVLMILPKIMLALCMKPNLRMAIWQLKFQLYSFLGVLKARLMTRRRGDIQRVSEFKHGTRKELIKEYKVI